MKPKILLAGLGETGSELAQRLFRDWSVVAIDTNREALEKASQIDLEENSITTHVGDATSSLVLKHTGLETIHAAVACTGSDEVNFEFLHVARSRFETRNLYALMYSLDWEERYQSEGIEIISQDHACAAILESRVQRGQKVAADVGLGEGEIIEVEVLPNSSVIGRPLAELRPQRWLVGAVYRDRKLIVPHGDTKLQTGDRVLIVGDPEILPSIATLIRTGESEFPLQYGSQIVTRFCSKTHEVLDEADYLIGNTRAQQLKIISAKSEKNQLTKLTQTCDQTDMPYEVCEILEPDSSSSSNQTHSRDTGVLIIPPERMSFWSRIGLAGTNTARLINESSSPLLISRKTTPYKKALLVLAELPFQTAAAQLAIDLTRMVGADLHLGLAHQPEIVAGNELKGELEQRRREIENLAGMYHVKMQTITVEGNPIREIIKLASKYDLLVLPYTKGRKAFLTRPDVGLNLIHHAPCSVLVMPC
jgi:trk/ktr system potassium uptake protein